MSYRPHPTKGTGWWQIVVEQKKTGSNGKVTRHQRYIKFKGSEAEAKTADVELNGKPVDSEYPTLVSLLPRFMAEYQTNQSVNSYKAMESALKALLPYYGTLHVPLLSNFHHEEYKAQRLAATYLPGKHGQKPEEDTPEESKRRKPLTRNSINRELNALNALLSYAERQRIAVGARPVLFPQKRSGRKPIVPLAPSQMMSLQRQIKRRDDVIIELMMIMGLRLNEAAGVRCEHIHLENNSLYVVGKGGAMQMIPIPPSFRQRLKEVKGNQQGGWLVVNGKTQLPYGDVTKRLNTLCRSAGITKPITHHTLRHSCATALILAGVPLPRVQSILRHESIETTTLYTHIAATFDDGNEPDIARLLFGLGDNKAGVTSVILMSSNGPVYADSQTCQINS